MDHRTVQTFDGRGNLIAEEVIPLTAQEAREEEMAQRLQDLQAKGHSAWTFPELCAAVEAILVLVGLGAELPPAED